MPADAGTTRHLNLVLSLVVTGVALLPLLMGAMNLYGFFADAKTAALQTAYGAYAAACFLSAAVVVWLAWWVLPHAFAPRDPADLRRTWRLLLLGLVLIVGSLVAAATVARSAR